MFNYKQIMFIDPGTSFGWAVAIVDNPKTDKWTSMVSGSVQLPTEAGPRIIGFWSWLESATAEYRNAWPGEFFIAWEEAAFSGFSKADRMYGTWEGVLCLFCEMHKIPYTAINGSTIKAWARKNGHYNTKSPKPRKLKKETTDSYILRLDAWKGDKTKYDKKPRARESWISKLTSKGKYLEHEIDARWGLEVLINYLEKDIQP